MRRLIQTAVVLLLMLLVGGVLGLLIRNARTVAARTSCINNLKFIGLAVQNYHDTYRHFPPGTVAGTRLPAEQRLSWLTEIWPNFMSGGISTRFDTERPWNAPENNPPRCVVRNYDGSKVRWDDSVVRVIDTFLCLANSIQMSPDLPSLTHYVGIAGIGERAAELPLSDSRVGFFGYDRKMSQGDIKDGLATTLMVGEVVDGGPWTAGGRWTTRGLSPGSPYLGEGGQFTSLHGPANLVFADGSVRPLSESVSPTVFEALATIAGNEDVGLP